MADVLIKDTSLRHIFPISDIVRRGVARNADCSALTDTPWDGEFVRVDGKTGFRLTDAQAGVGAANFDTVAKAEAQAAAHSRARMVWGSHKRTDRQANNHENVSILNVDMSIEVKCGLFCADDGRTMAGNFPAGTPLCLYIIADGSGVDRTVLAPISSQMDDIAAADYHWAVGEVIDTPDDVAPADNMYINVRLYARPRLVLAA